MKRIVFALIISFFSISLLAQGNATDAIMPADTAWKKSGMISFNLGQVSLSNWAQGGESSYSINGLSLFNMNYALDKTSWDNLIDIGYGVLKSGDNDLLKTDDHLDLLSKYGYKTSPNWYLSGMVNFKTQFTKGYQPSSKVVISDILAPGYILFSIGMEYKPNDNFFFSISPLAGKVTIVMNDSLSKEGSFGVDAGESVRSEFGGIIKVGVNKELMKNVNLTTSLDLFSNYLHNPQNIDISWKAMINMKINEYLSASITTHLLYDDDIAYTDKEGVNQGPQVQFKEILGIGLSVKF